MIASRRIPLPRAMLWLGAALASATTLGLLMLFGVSLVVAILILLAIFLMVVILALVRQLREAKSAREIEKTIHRQADKDIERSSPGKAAETQGLKTELLAAIEALKSSTVARRGGERALSVLPWYMLIGPSGAGKGSLVRSAGLHFLLLDSNQQPRSVQGVGGTRGIKWLLSQEAVLLDMAGGALGAGGTEGDEDWISFLQVLRKQRKAKALNGLIVAVPLDRVADSGAAEVKNLARSIRDRVQELIHQLRTVFPVYVVFTKADRVAGFSEFFADLDAAERARPWGATLSLERSRADRAEVLFDEEFPVLTGALSDRRMHRLSAAPDPIQRARVFAFPLQLEAVREKARSFIQILFEPDPVQEAPFFRGFYFTSSGEDGSVVDRVLEPASRSVGIATPEVPTPAGSLGGAYFTQDLFRNVIFADASLATHSTRGEIAQRRGRVVLFAGLAVMFLTLGIATLWLSGSNWRLVSRTRGAAINVAQRVEGEKGPFRNIRELERLRAQAALVDSFSRRTPFWRWLGCYSGDVLREPTLRVYSNRAAVALVVPAAEAMQQRLRRLNAPEQGGFLDYYNLYYAWRLLTNAERIVPEDAPILAREMCIALSPDTAYMSPEERASFPRLVASQAAFLASHARYLGDYVRNLSDNELERAGRNRIARTWDSSQFYRALMKEVREQAPDIPLAKLIKKQGPLGSARPLEGAFTLEAWENQVKPRVEAHTRRMERDWVVREAFGAHPPDLGDSLLMLYASDYSRAWAAFLNSLEVPPARTYMQAETLLRELARSDSPILETLRAVAQQTSLGMGPNSRMAQVQRDYAIASELFLSPKKANPASKLVSLVKNLAQRGALDENQSESERYVIYLQKAADQVHKAGQPGAPASEISRIAAAGDEGTNPFKYARGRISEFESAYQGDGGAASVARLLGLPIIAAAGAPCEDIKKNLTSKWTLLVVMPFQRTLAGKHPVESTGPDASIQDFTEFFRPGGTFWTFYSDNLKDYLAENGESRDERATQCFAPEFIQCLRKAYEIREAFFGGGAQGASLRFSVQTTTPEQQGPSVFVRGVSLDIGGQPTRYAMGASQWTEVAWPGANPDMGAALRLETAPGSPLADALSRTGPWGLFRLLDAADSVSTAEGNPAARWTVKAGPTLVTTTYEFRPSSAHHPFRKGSLLFTIPTGL